VHHDDEWSPEATRERRQQVLAEAGAIPRVHELQEHRIVRVSRRGKSAVAKTLPQERDGLISQDASRR